MMAILSFSMASNLATEVWSGELDSTKGFRAAKSVRLSTLFSFVLSDKSCCTLTPAEGLVLGPAQAHQMGPKHLVLPHKKRETGFSISENPVFFFVSLIFVLILRKKAG